MEQRRERRPVLSQRQQRRGKRVKAAEVDAAVLEVVVRDISGDAFAQAVLDHYTHQSKPATRDTTRAKLSARLTEIDRQSEKLAGLLGETSAPAALLRQMEKLEVERESIAGQLDAANEDEKTRAMLRKLSIGDVKRFLAGIASQMEADPELLKEALAGIIEKVLLDPATLEARVSYKIADLTGDKVASPRGSELIPGFVAHSAVVIPHRRRA